MKFLFDLDGTVTSEETLPLIAKHFDVQESINSLTKATIQGNVPFIESFIRRVNILGQVPISEVAALLEKVQLYPKVLEFIQTHQNDCIIVTGNLICWCEKLLNKIGCTYIGSESIQKDDKVEKLIKILRKEEVVRQLQASGEKVVFIGDGNNDLEAMRCADIAIATGLTHSPARSLWAISDYIIFNEEALCRQLNQLYSAAQV
ncbi:MAG: HAD family phosphatase [Bacteroidales bacterium]|nr:HAD family phosphatase [Bacteroidales bacterium]